MINSVFISGVVEGYDLVATLKDAQGRVVGYLDPSRFSLEQRDRIATLFRRAFTRASSQEEGVCPLNLKIVVPLKSREDSPKILDGERDISDLSTRSRTKACTYRFFAERIQQVLTNPTLSVREKESSLREGGRTRIRRRILQSPKHPQIRRELSSRRG